MPELVEPRKLYKYDCLISYILSDLQHVTSTLTLNKAMVTHGAITLVQSQWTL